MAQPSVGHVPGSAARLFIISWPAASLLWSALLAQTWTPLMGLLVWGRVWSLQLLACAQ